MFHPSIVTVALVVPTLTVEIGFVIFTVGLDVLVDVDVLHVVLVIFSLLVRSAVLKVSLDVGLGVSVSVETVGTMVNTAESDTTRVSLASPAEPRDVPPVRPKKSGAPRGLQSSDAVSSHSQNVSLL